MRTTSLEAYFKHALPNIGDKQALVLRTVILLQPCTDLQIAEHLKMPINSITPRRNELFKMGVIKEGEKVRQNGRNVYSWVTSKYSNNKIKANKEGQIALF